jgi:LAO/AO transport system kinase
VLKTVAQSGEGVEELIEAVGLHRTHLEQSGELEVRRRTRAEARIRDVVNRELRRRAWARDEVEARVARGADEVAAGEATPYSVAAEIVDGLVVGGG